MSVLGCLAGGGDDGCRCSDVSVLSVGTTIYNKCFTHIQSLVPRVTYFVNIVPEQCQCKISLRCFLV